MADRDLQRGRVVTVAEIVGLAVLSYVPHLLSDRGRVVADSKQALYVNPGRFLADAAHLWDPGVGAGTVAHQHIGYLWPMGPWFRLVDLIGLPVWVGQRLWLGSLVFLAALGARRLIRSMGLGSAAASAGAVAYALTPFQFVFAARASVLLLPWVALPWLIELTRRALDRGGWRHPALFALVTATAAGVNAPTLALVLLGPAAVLVVATVRGEGRRAMATGGRLALLSALTGLWWAVPLLLQARYGLDVLAVTEDLRATSSRSAPDDVLRGLGNWFFYGGDRLGPHAPQAPFYEGRGIFALLSFLLPSLGLAGLVLVRWRHRLLATVLLGATVLAVGVWPYDDTTLLGMLLRWITDRSIVGFAFRNSSRIVPLVVLGLALGVAVLVAVAPPRFRNGAAVGVIGLALAGLAPASRVGMLAETVSRPEAIPAHWIEAAAHLDDGSDDTRVLELPGSNFAAYRWGNAIEPITPLLVDRSYLAREVLPYGSPESALLLDALDRRLQHGVLDPSSVAPVARLLGVGDIVVRTDLANERFGLLPPTRTWATLLDPEAPGLGEPVGFGEPVSNAHGGVLDPLLPGDLVPDGGSRDEPRHPVTVVPVEDVEPIVGTRPADGGVLVDGDADGIVDAAAASLIDGHELVLLAGALSDDQLVRAVNGGARVVLTDSNRRRSQTWFTSIRDTRGPTEQEAETLRDPSGHDARLPPFADATDADRTVARHLGATVTASTAGGAARPEDRPVAAFDGLAGTSWRIGGADPRGEHITIDFDAPRDLDEVRLLQPQDGPRDRRLERVVLDVGDGDPITVDLDERSVGPPGQMVPIERSGVAALTVRIDAVSDPGFDPAMANAVGFAEIDIDGLEVSESLRLPTSLLHRLDADGDRLPLDLVLTRLRVSADEWDRPEQEPALDRIVDLPTDRSFAVSGVLRVADRATDAEIDEILGTTGTLVRGSGRLQGSPDSRASRVLDGDAATWWTDAFGDDEAAVLELRNERAVTIEDLDVTVIVDGRHSVPRRVGVEVDGRRVGEAALDPAPTEEGVVRLAIHLDEPVRTDRLRLIFDDLDRVFASTPEQAGAVLPLAVAEVAGTGFAPVAVEGDIDDVCRDDVLRIGDDAVPIRIDGRRSDGSLTFEVCDTVDLAAGESRIRSSHDAPFDLDQLVLTSPGPTSGSIVPPAKTAGTEVLDTTAGRTGYSARVRTDGEPFWFVSGQSALGGWSLDAGDASVRDRAVVDGYANAWLVEPAGPGEVELRADWRPQRLVWLGFGASLLAALGCVVIVVTTHGRRFRSVGVATSPRLTPTWPDFRGDLVRTPNVLATLSVAFGVAFVSRWWIGLLAGLTAHLVGRRPAVSSSVALAAPMALVSAHLTGRHELGWVAFALVVAAVVADVSAPSDPPEERT